LRLAGRRDQPVKLPVINDGPEFPSVLDYLWGWFEEISFGLSPNGFAPPVITWEALRAWQALTGVGVLEPWEAKTLVQLGMLRASISAEKTEADNRSNRQGPAPQPRMGGAGAGTSPSRSLSLPRR
jgi:hypothetical protein